MSFEQRMKNKQRRILVARPDRLGDVILSTSIPREIKKKYPDALVAVLVREYTKAVYENNPHVDIILTDDFDESARRKSFWKKVKEIKKYKFSDALMLLPTERHNWMFFWAGIPNRIGVGTKLYQVITFTKSVSRKKYIPLRHEADYCMDLARKIGIIRNDISPEIYFSEEEKLKLEEARKKKKTNNEYWITIHSTFGGSSPNVKPKIYREVIDALTSYSNIKVTITDPDISDELKNIPGVNYVNDNLRNLFVVIAAQDLLVSSSTGPCHIAGAVKTPTLTLFCRLPACSSDLWSPLGNEAFYLKPEENYCQTKCPGDPKLCWFEDQGGIDSEKILTKIFEIMAGKGFVPKKF